MINREKEKKKDVEFLLLLWVRIRFFWFCRNHTGPTHSWGEIVCNAKSLNGPSMCKHYICASVCVFVYLRSKNKRPKAKRKNTPKMWSNHLKQKWKSSCKCVSDSPSLDCVTARRCYADVVQKKKRKRERMSLPDYLMCEKEQQQQKNRAMLSVVMCVFDNFKNRLSFLSHACNYAQRQAHRKSIRQFTQEKFK